MLIGAGKMALVQCFRATPLCSDRLNRAEPLVLLVGRPGLDPGTLGLKVHRCTSVQIVWYQNT